MSLKIDDELSSLGPPLSHFWAGPKVKVRPEVPEREGQTERGPIGEHLWPHLVHSGEPLVKWAQVESK